MSAKSNRKKKLEHTRTIRAAALVSDTTVPQPQFIYWLLPGLIALVTFVEFLPTLLLPVSGIVADRFSYLPSLGWVVLLGASLFHSWKPLA
jgi:hypothetical protein